MAKKLWRISAPGVSGLLLSGLIFAGAVNLGGVEPVRYLPLFAASTLLLAWRFLRGLRIPAPGWWLLAPILPMVLAGSQLAAVFQYLLFWSVFVLAADHVTRQQAERVPWLAVGLMVLGGAEALLGLGQAMSRFAGHAVAREAPFQAGTYYNYNHFAGLMAMLAPLFAGIGWSRMGQRPRAAREAPRIEVPASESVAQAWLFLLGGGILFLAALFSMSRGGTMAAAVGLSATALVLAAARQRRRGIGGGAAMLAWVLIAILLCLALWIGLDPVIERFGRMSQDLDQGRNLIWRDTLRLIADHPLLGVGAGNYPWAFKGYQTFVTDLLVDYAHNDYLQAAADWGLPAAGIFFGVLIFLVVRTARAAIDAGRRSRRELLAGCAGGITALLFHSLTDFNLHIPANAMVFAALAGMSWGMARRTEVAMINPLDGRRDGP